MEINSWPKYKVAELEGKGYLLVQDGNHGEYRPRQHEFCGQIAAFIRAADLENGQIKFDQAEHINEAAYKRIIKGKAQGGDIIFSHKGTVGKLALAPLDSPTFVCSPQTTFWRTLNEDVIDRKFLFYYMQSSEFMNQWLARKGETDMADYVSLTAQRQLVLEVPEIGTQRAINSILSVLDDKIELNRQMNRTLEATTQAIFKSWFVDFDPVTAKAAGRKPFGIASEISGYFQSEFIDSELGQIPFGWEVRKIEDCIDRVSVGKKYEQKTALSKGKVPILDQGKSGIIGFHNDAPGLQASIERPVIVFANHTCYMRLITFPFSAIQNVLPFIGKGFDTIWVYFATYGLQEFVEYKGHWPDFVIKKIVVPNNTDLTLIFAKKVRPMVEKISSNENENKVLRAVRDLLLPKLLSGEVRVKQAEKIVEKVS